MVINFSGEQRFCKTLACRISLSCSLPFVSVETGPDGYLVGKELVILLFVCVVGKYFVIFYVFSFPPGVFDGTLNLIASIPGPSILSFQSQALQTYKTMTLHYCTHPR